jgi:hypothetical protein
MYPDLLHELPPLRVPLSREPIPAFGRVEALRRLLARTAAEGPYPHCPRCGRALLAETSMRFACPSGHVTITLPSRWPSVWRWARAMFGHSRAGVRA